MSLLRTLTKILRLCDKLEGDHFPYFIFSKIIRNSNRSMYFFTFSSKTIFHTYDRPLYAYNILHNRRIICISIYRISGFLIIWDVRFFFMVTERATRSWLSACARYLSFAIPRSHSMRNVQQCLMFSSHRADTKHHRDNYLWVLNF